LEVFFTCVERMQTVKIVKELKISFTSQIPCDTEQAVGF